MRNEKGGFITWLSLAVYVLRIRVLPTLKKGCDFLTVCGFLWLWEGEEWI